MPTIVAHTMQYPPYRRIGAELATHELLKYLQRDGWDVIARPAEQPDPHVHAYEHDGVRVSFEPITSPDLPSPDVVLHGGAHFDIARMHARAHKALQVMWLHGGWASWQVGQVQAARPGLLVYNSHSQRRGINHLLNVASTVLHPPVWPLNEPRWPRPFGYVTLVNTTEGKGAQVFYDLAEYMPTTQFLAVGGGHGLQMAPPDLPNLEFRQHGTPMEQVWRDTAVLLMPSSTESWGMVAVEAMHRGIPVIGMDVPGLKECLGWIGDDAGPYAMPLVQPQDCVHGPQAWAAVLRNTLATWDAWSMKALGRSAELDPARELADFTAMLNGRVAKRRAGVEV